MEFYRYEKGNIKYPLGYRELNGIPLLSVDLKLIKFVLIKETPKGYWISNNITGLRLPSKWVSKTGKKRYAYPTKREALESRIAISKRRLRFLKIDLEIVSQILHSCQTELEKLNTEV